nr:hypothetical protein [Tanacetum cinerariifolium]
MAGEGPANMIARRVTDDIISFSGETAPLKFMKFFLIEKVAESRRFVNRMRDEATTARDSVAQLSGKLLALNEVIVDALDEIFVDALDEIKTQANNVEILDGTGDDDAKRGEEGKLLALNEVIVDALDEIKTQANNVEILDGTGMMFEASLTEDGLPWPGNANMVFDLRQTEDGLPWPGNANMVFDLRQTEDGLPWPGFICS